MLFYTIYDCKENATNIQGQIWQNHDFTMNLSSIFTNYGSCILHYIAKIYSSFVYILKEQYMSKKKTAKTITSQQSSLIYYRSVYIGNLLVNASTRLLASSNAASFS